MGLPSGSAGKNPPAMQETWVRSLGQEDPLEEGMATTPLFFAGESHGERSLAGYSPWGYTVLDMTEVTQHAQFSSVQSLSCVRLFSIP